MPARRELGLTLSDPDRFLNSVPPGERELVNETDVADMPGPLLLKAIARYHHLIPKQYLVTWVTNLRSTIEEMQTGSHIGTADGCSGTGIWMLCNKVLFKFWKDEFGVGEDTSLVHHFACELDPRKRNFHIRHHPDTKAMFGDVADLVKRIARDYVTGKDTRVPQPHGLFGGGFSCKLKTKLNNNRSQFTSCIKDEIGSTGQTFKYLFEFSVLTRSVITVLENLKECQQQSLEYDPDSSTMTATSEDEFIRQKYERENFTCLLVPDDAQHHKSKARRERLWFVILDMPTSIAKQLDVEANYHRVFDALRDTVPYPFEYFEVPEDVLLQMNLGRPLEQGHRKCAKKDEKWQAVHEELFNFATVPWPPTLDDPVFKRFRERAAEVVFLANTLWEPQDSEWEFLETLHSAERVFGWPIVSNRSLESSDPKKALRNPWKSTIPTMTGGSAICGRRMDKNGKVILKKIHPLEMFQLNGWDISMWEQGSPYLSAEVDDELLVDLAGNSWSSFSYVPVIMAAMGCVNWNEVNKLKKEMKMQAEMQEQSLSEGSSSLSEEETQRL